MGISMINKCKFLLALTLVIVFLLYKDNLAAAMAEEQNTDSVSTGAALTEWLEAHKNTGGTVKLSDHVILDGEYIFCPDGMNSPDIIVDTGQYTITVTGEIEFLSDYHLTFLGQPDGKSIFYVAEKGMLYMTGITVESGQYTFWQEEGAGLSIDGCRIRGDIHYAKTPFVVDWDSVCIVVEKGQTLSDVLPAAINCTVNRQGEISHNEPVPVSWDLTGCEKQQEQRQRLRLQGCFVQAASAEAAVCTAAYNDYPLTFTEVRASVTGSMYIFQGWYTKPEEHLPITVASEYSFDGENWLTDEEKFVADKNASFQIIFPSEQCNTEAHPNIYIRLQWNDNGTLYFSNVLCYAAGNLECVEDIGGSRGGGTSITNPPDEPQISVGTAALEKEEPSGNADRDNDSGNTGSETPADTNPTESGDGAASDGQSFNAGIPNANAEQQAYAEAGNTYEEQPLYAETQNAGQSSFKENISHSDSGNSEKAVEAVAAISVKRENHAGITIVMSAGFVLLAAIAGIAGFCVHSRSGTKR